MPVQRYPGGTVAVTGNAMLGVRAHTLLMSMRLYIETDGRMQSTRMATPTVMRELAAEFTGKRYMRSRKGLEAAYADLQVLCAGKNLDEIGEVLRVNEAVGGIAADLDDATT